MQIEKTRLAGVKIIRPRRVNDMQGHIQESWHRADFAGVGLPSQFAQENQSYMRLPGTRRGLHFQAPPYAQDRLIRVLAGEVLQVAVDARARSATYGEWTSAVLSAANGRQMFVPQGFLHGFVTLVPNTTLLSKVTAPNLPTAHGAVLSSDDDLAIDWGMPESAIQDDPRDAGAASFASWRSPFLASDAAA